LLKILYVSWSRYARLLTNLGYGRYPNTIESLERILDASDPRHLMVILLKGKATNNDYHEKRKLRTFLFKKKSLFWF